MKKLFVLFLLTFMSPSFAVVVDNFTNVCGENAYHNLAASFTPKQYTCSSGQFLPADTLGCETCPSGATCAGGTYSFSEHIAHGVAYNAPITQTQDKLCSTSFNKMRTKFTPKQYTCASGEFLPADTLGCENCPSGATCGGGTFSFSENVAHGVAYNAPITQAQDKLCSTSFNKMRAKFTPTHITCAPGTYLEADAITCTQCPIGSYCPGDTYTFNETNESGKTICPNGWTSPAGSTSVGQCGYVLHIGQEFIHLRSERLTNTSLNFRIGNDIFYGNMTTTPTVYHAGTNHELKIQIGNTIYYVYDDTVNL